MRVLICNPPWYPAKGGWGVRAGAEPPRVVPVGSPVVPWPWPLAFATALLKQHDHVVSLADSVATRESSEGFLQRISELSCDVVALASCRASLEDDLPLITAAAQMRQVVVLFADGTVPVAEVLLQVPGLRAVVLGEPEMGLLAAAQLDQPMVYPPDPVRDLDDLPLPYRDHAVHRYREPLPGQPAGPQLALRVSRGPERWRSLAALGEEVELCRRNYPRLTHLFVADPAANAAPDRFAALADQLACDGWPWSARVTLHAPLPDGLRTAAACEMAVERAPDAGELAALRALVQAGVTVSLKLAEGVPPDWTAETGAVLPEPEVPAAPPPAVAAQLAIAPPPVRPSDAIGTGERGRLYIVGQQVPYYMPPWLLRAAAEMGYEAVPVDYFADPRAVLALLASQPDELILFDRGHAFPPDLLERIAARKVLYYPDVLPTLRGCDPVARVKYDEFCAVAPRYDDVILHDSHGLEYLLREGHTNIRGVVPLPYDPARHRDLGGERDVEVLFMGLESDHRHEWISRIREAGVRVEWPQLWGDDYIAALNRAKITLNLHFTAFPNTELRIVEALACGSLVVSEPTTEPFVFEPGRQVVHVTLENAAETIRWWLAHPAERQAMVAAGQRYVAERFTARHCLETILGLLPERP